MAGEPTFEQIYREAGDDLAAVPWASLAPMPALVGWLDQQPAPETGSEAAAARALVVACGLGDDAEELSGRGYRVTAFDLVPAAIEHCHQRFPHSAVDYQVADVFRLPDAWRERFGLVVEIRTLQSLPLDQRARAAGHIAGTVAPGGRVFVHGLFRDDGQPAGSRPWPLSPGDLAAFERAGLAGTAMTVEALNPNGKRAVTAVYSRP
jgi:hypothetical protein